MQTSQKNNLSTNPRQRGFSLIEVLIAGGIMSAMALLLYQTLGNQQKSAKKIEVRIEADSIINDIRQTLGSRDSCLATLGGRNASNTAIGVITDIKHLIKVFSGPPLPPIIKFTSNTNFDSAVKYGSGGVKILSYRLSAVDPQDPSIGMVAGDVSGTTNLIITFRNNLKEPIFEQRIRIDVTTVSAANRAIATCSSSGAIADFDARYVDVLGDTMTGNLIMSLNSNIEIQGTGTIIMSSDKRLKKNIHSLSNVTSKINKLRPVSYVWKEDDKPASGLVAQEVQNIFPELVHQRKDSDFLAIDYIQLSPYIIKGLQETNQENVMLRKKIKTLNEEFNQVKEYLCQKDPQSSLCTNFELKR